MQTITLSDAELISVRLALHQRADREDQLADKQLAMVTCDETVAESAQRVAWADYYRSHASATRRLLERLTATPATANNPVFCEF